MTSIIVGLASGLGNAVFMLPAIKALKSLGHNVSLYIQTDFPTASMFRRCAYVNDVIEAPGQFNGCLPVCGQWRPADWAALRLGFRFQLSYPYQRSETDSNMRIAEALGWKQVRPDVSDWCQDLDRTKRWDVGVIPGCKGGTWLRKRWPQLANVAAHYVKSGMDVGVFGLPQDGVLEFPGDHVDTSDIATLPDMLAGCRVIVGTDSGPMHLASSLGIPVVMIYTATSEIKGEPMGPHRKILPDVGCRPCQTTPRWAACSDWRCHQIEIKRVIDAANEFLHAGVT